jgi:hypothetical protein
MRDEIIKKSLKYLYICSFVYKARKFIFNKFSRFQFFSSLHLLISFYRISIPTNFSSECRIGLWTDKFIKINWCQLFPIEIEILPFSISFMFM